jgi:parvulin-like peptidyl-prolyl isomerase
MPLARAASPDTTAPATNSMDAVTALFGDPVIAKGTGVAVKQSDLDEVLTGIKTTAAARGQQIPPEQLTRLEAQMLERLIDIQLLLQHANDADKADGAKKGQVAMDSLLQRAGSQETLDMQLKAAGTTEDALRAKVTDEATAMAALQRELGVEVTADDVKKFYDDHPADFEQPEMVHVRHILLMTIDPTTQTPLPDDTVQAKHKQAEDVLARARAGEDFAKLAEQYSDDPTTKDKGGDLPPFSKGQMLPEFEAAAFSLTNNQVSDIVETRYGYHIIQFIDKTPAKKLELTDIVPQSKETISDRIKEVLVQQKTEELATPYLQKLKAAAAIQITDPELNDAVQALESDTNTVPAGASAPAPASGN